MLSNKGSVADFGQITPLNAGTLRDFSRAEIRGNQKVTLSLGRGTIFEESLVGLTGYTLPCTVCLTVI